ncbi:MAG TPA: type I DNA topoisomerase [Candidatus Sulfotelmatobacter sp.]|nr:type I DNA topoisomerase [Candidatus Sulfotelmatobacter sp.]
MKNLVIVESPAKAKTIEKFLGKDFSVKSSFGHIRDLPKKGLNIEIDNNFKPIYEISQDKKKVVSDLKKAAKGHEVWLASDEDREGEAIAWHLTVALGLDPKKTKRIVFHEITKTAIDRAVDHPRVVDMALVNAQQARRVLDRLVGYELSPVLWRKVRGGLSAGRVQSVAVRLIVEREREIKDFKPEASFKVTAQFSSGKSELSAELDKKFKTKEEVTAWLKDIASANFSVKSIEKKPGKRNPGAPFTTSTLQQEASQRLGYSVRQTMTLAQRLYEAGQITYMRTDSTILSELALTQAEAYIKKEYGAKYHERRQYRTKQEGAQEAHEAIRPTNFSKTSHSEDAQQKRLYELIWQRAIASQMSPAQIDRTVANITISNKSEQFSAKGEILLFDGYLKVYGGGKDDVILPDLKQGQELKLLSALAAEQFSRPPARYSEASLVKKLEELGIGRPSTYAPTISTIQTRGYVEKKDLEGAPRDMLEISLKGGKVSETTTSVTTGADRAKLFPTSIAEVVNDFLVKYFPSIVDYDFTAKVEKDFDDIEEGKESWQSMIKDFYGDFHKLVKKSEDVSRSEVSKAREIGVDPATKKPIIARIGRFGPVLQKGDTEDEDVKPDFAPLPEGATIDTVTLEQAIEMFELPRTVGKTKDGEEIKANIGRFGPYIQVGKLFVSIKPLDPYLISEKEANKLYQEKLAKDKAKHIKEFDSGIKILNGPYGPYVTDGKTNARIDKGTDPKSLTEAKAKELLATQPAKKFRSRKQQFKSN